MTVEKNKNIMNLIKLFTVILVVTFATFMAFYSIEPNKTVAAGENTITIKIDKVTTVSTYAFGAGVEFVESTSNYDIYTAEVGSIVRLQAINETRIFTDWVITKNADSADKAAPTFTEAQLKQRILTFEVVSGMANLDVTVNRKNADASHYGQYMMDRFVITDEADLIALQNILSGSTKPEDFDKFYENPISYANMEATRKLMQYGYYLISNNFTVFNEKFVGIGTKEYPFQGIMCGENGTKNSKLFITISDSEKVDPNNAVEESYGLFKYLGNEAVVRNLVISTSIGINSKDVEQVNQKNIIYAGGLAGVMDQATLIDVTVSTSIGITSNHATEIYAGGVAGILTTDTGIDSISDVVYEGTESKWSIVSHKEDAIMSAGLVAGKATDAYIKEVDIIVTDQLVDLKNDSVTGTETDSKLYLGNVFGTYIIGSHNHTIDDIMIMGEKGESLRAITTNGEVAVGGLIGLVDSTSTGQLNIERVYFRALGSMNEFSASTISTDDVANIYAGGVIGYINNNAKVIGLDAFVNRFQNIVETSTLVANYLFEGEYQVSAVQNGTSTNTNNGKAIAGGIIGKGYMELSGIDTSNKNQFAVTSPTSSLLVEAIQSKLTGGNGKLNDKEHACAALIYGSVGSTALNVSNINVYTNNTKIQAIREIGTEAVGDLHVGGFIGYASGSNFSNIGLYFNNSSISAESLSYIGFNNTVDSNSAFCGGFTGELIKNSSLTNIEFAGYDTDLLTKTGTNSNLESIQNTKPGGNNYMGENYIGGIVGRIQYTTLTNCRFIGSSTNNDYIRMSGHQSPDSAFCGGIVGLIRTAENGVPSTVIDCEVTGTEVSGSATNVNLNYSDPDIYVGGIVGATYIHDTNVTINISNCRVNKTNVYALGNEIITTYAGGILGGTTWSSSIRINDCYVTDSTIKATMATTIQNNKNLESSAAGIVGGMKGSATRDNVNIAHCTVIDTDVTGLAETTFTNIKAYAAGILGYCQSNTTINITNCYSNALVNAKHNNASGTAEVYGIAHRGSKPNNSTNKTVTGLVTEYTHKTFTANGYTFELVDNTGRFIIRKSNGRYVTINGSRLSETTSQSRATRFQYNNGYLVSGSRYIAFNNTKEITSSTTPYSFVDNNLYKPTETVVEGTVSNTNYFQSYYLKKNAKGALDESNGIGTAIGTGPFEILEGKKVNPYTVYNYISGFDGSGQKFYIEIIDEGSPFVVYHELDKIVSLTSNNEGQALAHLWINAKADGDTSVDGSNNLIAPNHEDKEAAAKNGWFILDYVLLYTGNLTSIKSNISDIKTSYTDGKTVYNYDYENNYIKNANGDIIKNNYTEAINSYIEDEITYTVKEFTFKVYENMLTLNVDFQITHFGANYKLLFVEEDGTVIDETTFKQKYGDIELKLIEKHADHGNDKYQLIFKPNEDIEKNAVFMVYLEGGNNLNIAETYFKFNLHSNDFKLVGVTYAEYTPPLNYYENDSTLGTESNPYKLYVGSSTKFIPMFTRINDLLSYTYIEEEYIEKCTYAITENSANFKVQSNGEVIAGNIAGEKGSLSVTYGDTTVIIYLEVVDNIKVNYSIVGADIEGLTHATSDANFYFEQYIRSNYGGEPTSAVISIKGVNYDLTSDPDAYIANGIKVYAITRERIIINTPIEKFDINALGYVIEIDKTLLEGVSEFDVNITYPVVYQIKFDLQCEKFNPDYIGGLSKSYKIVVGTTYKQFFEDTGLKDEIKKWADDASIFGLVFTGFYLVNEAGSVQSYGISFDDLAKSSYYVNSSNTFYGRWSYLIELIEAPGTYIKTGFNSSLMHDYVIGQDKIIKVPINANQGYLFRVDTDDEYHGKPGVEAYVVFEDKTMKEIPVELYPENNNLYYIRPENITGYLVVMTTAGNSEVIVGENTSSVTENITTEDGIITFKYVVNHYNDGINKSYIYNVDGYQNLTKEFVLDFYKQSDHSVMTLPDLTEIRVYYNVYINGSLNPSKTIIGTYITYNDDRVYLTEFKLLDLETQAFGNTRTFGDALGSYKNVTEIFYFTITPPNGYSEHVKNEMANYVVECGYCYGKVATHQPIKYLTAPRTTKELVNNEVLVDINTTETSRQLKEFHLVPTRLTTLEKESDNTYTFTDDKTYSVYDITLQDTQKLPDFNYISLYDDTRNSILESSVMKFNIKELRLRLGYRLGKVRVYGRENEFSSWKIVGEIDVTSAVYNDYTISFKDSDGNYPYYAYKIDNISTNEIRVSNIDVLSAKNGVLYKGPITDFEEKYIYTADGVTKYTYSLIHQIVGDSRHDGKTFMLAVQLTSNEITPISEIINDVYIRVNNIGLNIDHYTYLNSYSGKNTAYFNLSTIIDILNVKEINFSIHIPAGTSVYTYQLLEVTNEYKPASGEVRIDYTKLHVHQFVDGKCSCGAKQEQEISNPVLETIKLVAYDNSAFVSGGFVPSAGSDAPTHTSDGKKVTNSIDVNYLCDRDVLPNNSLSYQNKILLVKVNDNVYKVIDVVNNNNNSVKGRTDWTHAIATAYYPSTQTYTYYTSMYSKYINKYIIIEDGLITSSSYTSNTYFYEKIYDAARKKTWDHYVNAYICEYPTTEISTIHYDLNGGEWNETPSGNWLGETGGIFKSDVYEGSTVNLPTPKKFGYRFVGWYEVGQQVSNSFTARDCLLVARWEKAVYTLATDSTTALQQAINNAVEGATIILPSGQYDEGDVTINKPVTLLGHWAGIKPMTDGRGSESFFFSDIIVNSDNVVIDGIALSTNGCGNTTAEKTTDLKKIAQIKGGSNGFENLTIKNVYVHSHTNDSHYSAFEFLATNNQEFKNIIIDSCRYRGEEFRTLGFYGSNINGLTIINCDFNNGGELSDWADCIKIAGANERTDQKDSYGIKGDVTIMNNTFTAYKQYTVWFQRYGAGNYNITNNVFTNCGQNVKLENSDSANGMQSGDTYHSAITFGSYNNGSGSTTGNVNIKANYNTAINSFTLLRINYNESRIASAQIVEAHYNKIINSTGTYLIDNRNGYYHDNSASTSDANIPYVDARYNFYGTATDVNDLATYVSYDLTTDAGKKKIKYGTTESYTTNYTSIYDVPVYPNTHNSTK